MEHFVKLASSISEQQRHRQPACATGLSVSMLFICVCVVYQCLFCLSVSVLFISVYVLYQCPCCLSVSYVVYQCLCLLSVSMSFISVYVVCCRGSLIGSKQC